MKLSIVSRAHLRPPSLYSALAMATSFAAPAWAEAERSAASPLTLVTVTVTAAPDAGPKVDRSGSAKIPVPLLDVPQTITVLPQRLLQEQNAQSLRQALSNVPGITFNAGEGGAGSGDSINIRGFSANANMQLDGLRDSAQTYRSDLFNLEAVEVIKGPNSVFGGAGTTGGSINMVSKQPKPDAFTELSAGLGTDQYRRLTMDSNQRLSEAAALRLNLMAHRNDVPGRDFIDAKRWGVAPSLSLGIDGPTKLTLSYLHQYDDKLPDNGVPALNGKRLAGVSRNAYYGWRNLDKDQATADAVTVKLEHRFANEVELQNLMRHARLERDTVFSGARVSVGGKLPPDRYLPAGPQGYGRETNNTMWINQTNITTRFASGSWRHTLVSGVEISRETYDRQGYGYALSALFPADGYPLSNPPGYWSGPVRRESTDRLDASLEVKALYALDHIELSPRWDLGLGLRYDWMDGKVNTVSAAGAASEASSSDRKLSGRAGLVFKPAEAGRVYLSYGTSFNPSAEFLAANGSGLDRATANLEPEKNQTVELGSKWEVLDGGLALTGALFQVDKDNARERLADNSYAMTRKQRVRGLELGASGKLTGNWGLFANYAYLDGKTLQADAASGQAGEALANTPRHAFNLWTTYALPAGWSLAYGARYIGERKVTSAGGGSLDAYWVHSAMLGYKLNRRLSFQLNLENLGDKAYVERVRQQAGGGAQTSLIEYGDGRSAVLSAVYKF
ncbi:TonB-dependent receptor [Chromobacterium aquaticum]|uniref:TonB-dependent receptor n=1 Tax=Chromobacterium aquaticum TaxID=467180 RepID=A0ABV8ZWQ6_9NEIS|nr:TonB-dependent siderophore receptor [Chromobacterium aquaticum]MCD5360926.1 TonB-dependent siderophore receptor [Chromobacterium aquaticum]